MFLFPNGKQYIINYLNTTFRASFAPEEFTWVGPRALTTAEATLYPDETVSVQLRATNDAKAYGNLDVYYHRLDIGSHIGMGTDNDIELPISFQLSSLNTDCLGSLYQFVGIELTPDEIKPVAIDFVNRVVTFEVTDTSLLWTGVLKLRIKPGDAVLGDIVSSGLTSTQYAYPNINTNNGQAPLYAYNMIFTDAMRNYQNSGTNLTTGDLLKILGTTGDPWTVYRSPSAWNLFEATVLYNGPNKPEYPTDPYFERVLVVNLALYCTNLAGNLYIQYNSSSL